MYFRMLLDEASGQITYLLADLDASQAVLIDPRAQDATVIHAMLEEHHLRLARVLYTDGHDPAPARWSVQKAAIAEGLDQTNDAPLSDGEAVVFGAEHLRVMATPGHTDLGLSYQWRDRVFCGDLLTPMSCPECPGVSSSAAWWDSVSRRIFNLPPETLLFSGHSRSSWSVSNVLTQRRTHPWFAGLRRDDALALMKAI
jgi:sulfur dioxygenase